MRFSTAIIGCGTVAHAHASAIGSLPDRFELTACCSRRIERARAFADTHAVAHATADVAEVLASEAVDVVVVCTPPRLHFEMVTAALDAGKHVICEKPLTASLALVDRIIEAERRSVGRVMPVFQCRFGNGFAGVDALVRSGLLGRAFLFTAETARRRGADYYSIAGRGERATEFGGVFMNQAIHVHDLLFQLAAAPVAVSAFIATRVNPIEVEDCGVASIRLADGALASLAATLGASEPLTQIRLVYQHATIECRAAGSLAARPGEAPWTIVPADGEVGRAIDDLIQGVPAANEGFAGQYRAFHDSVVSGAPFPVALEDARASLELATAIYHAAVTDTVVGLPLPDDHPRYGGWTEMTTSPPR